MHIMLGQACSTLRVIQSESVLQHRRIEVRRRTKSGFPNR
jgi:hypothetical protein